MRYYNQTPTHDTTGTWHGVSKPALVFGSAVT